MCLYFILFEFFFFFFDNSFGQFGVDRWQFAIDFDAILSLRFEFFLNLALFELVKVERIVEQLGLLIQSYVHEIAMHVSSEHIGANKIGQANRFQFLFGHKFVIIVNLIKKKNNQIKKNSIGSGRFPQMFTCASRVGLQFFGQVVQE